MDTLSCAELARIGEVILGILYAAFGRGPRIDELPGFAMPLLRLIIPVPMIAISLFQAAWRSEQRYQAEQDAALAEKP
jgi:hypothetical protein